MRGFTMTPSQRVRNGCEAARNARWRAAGGYFKVLLVTLKSRERKNKTKHEQGIIHINGKIDHFD